MFEWLWPMRVEARRALGAGFVLAALNAAATSIGLGIASLGVAVLVALVAQYGSRFSDHPTKP